MMRVFTIAMTTLGVSLVLGNGFSSGDQQSPFGNRQVAGSPSAAEIRYRLATPGRVSLAIYNKDGIQIRTLRNAQPQAAGEHAIVWDRLDRDEFRVHDRYKAAVGQPQFEGLKRLLPKCLTN